MAGLAPLDERALPRRGLTSAHAAATLAAEGPNRLPAPQRIPAWQRFVHQLVHFFALMLRVAAGLAWLAVLEVDALHKHRRARRAEVSSGG